MWYMVTPEGEMRMCTACVSEHGGVEITDAMRATAELVRDFYDLPGCSVGGPLHIVTDDYNTEDGHLAFCRKALAGPDEWHDEWRTPERDRLGFAILDALGAMTLAERSHVLGLAHDHIPPDA